MSLSEWQALGYDQHSVLVDVEAEIFVNHNSGNFRLLENSQPVDFGTSLVSPVVNFDIENNSRPQGNGFDIGAYEFVSPTSINNENNVVKDFELFQNYPNPFNPKTKIKFTIPFVETRHASSVQVILKVYDVLGNEIVTLINEEKSAGIYEVNFDASNLSSGIYYYKLIAGNFSLTKKMVYLK
jgi:hypothetical protein